MRGGQSCCATEQCQHRSTFPAADGAGRVRILAEAETGAASASIVVPEPSFEDTEAFSF